MNGELAGPGDRFVSINNDTVYSIAPDTSNWLPAPAAPFRPILRLYQPRASVLDGSYRIPPIRKAGRQSSQ